MKKLLLLAAAAMIAGASSAQTFSKQGNATSTKSTVTKDMQVSIPATKVVSPSKEAMAINKKKEALLLSKKFNVDANIKLNANAKKAASVQAEYTGSGSVTGNGTSPWTMKAGTLTSGGTALVDIIPNPYPTSLENGVAVEYTLSGNTLTVKPVMVFSSSSWHAFIFGSLNDDGSFQLTLGDDGSLTVPSDEVIFYGAFSGETFDTSFDTYMGYIEYVANIKYALPGQIIAPIVEYNPAGLYLFANVSSSFYGYQASYAMVPAYSNVTLINGTTDVADAWSWSIVAADGESEKQTATTKDFTFKTTANAYTPAKLVGFNQEAKSDTFALGTAKGNKTTAYIFAGDYESGYEFDDNTYATITMANPDNQLSYFSAFATPDKNSQRSIQSLIFYQGKPESPLYIEGISYSVSKFTVNNAEKFALKCKIQKVTMGSDGWLTLGDVIAQADLSANDIEEGYDGGAYTMTKLNWKNFYVEDEDGMTASVDYLFLEDEFAVVIEGWDNGTFTCEHTWGESSSNDQAAMTCFYFATGDQPIDENMYRMGYKQRQLIGFIGATYGYLYTADNTNVTLPVSGGQATIQVTPMFSNQEANENGSKTRLWLDDTSDEIPNWLNISYANEVYTENESSFNLVFSADALPTGVEGRQAKLVFVQEGAKLAVTVTQGSGDHDGIESVIMDKKDQNGIYNLQGVRIAKPQQKGIYIVNNKKVVVK